MQTHNFLVSSMTASCKSQVRHAAVRHKFLCCVCVDALPNDDCGALAMRNHVASRSLRRTTIVKLSLFWTAVAVPIGLLAWASDEITLQGQPTVYTVNFERGEWDGSRCTGKLVPGSRYRYKAAGTQGRDLLGCRRIVLSGRLSDCTVRDPGNWFCNGAEADLLSITREMSNDRATHGPQI